MKILGILLASLFLTSTAFADNAIYEVNGSNLTFIGNDVCGVGGDTACVEVFNVSFKIQQPSIGLDGLGADNVLSPTTILTSGPLSGFTCCNGEDAGLPGGFIAAINSAGDELDILQFGDASQSSTYFADIFGCHSATCASDFLPLGVTGCFHCADGTPSYPDFLPVSGTFTVTLVDTPEPSLRCLLGIGLLGGLGTVFTWGRKSGKLAEPGLNT